MLSRGNRRSITMNRVQQAGSDVLSCIGFVSPRHCICTLFNIIQELLDDILRDMPTSLPSESIKTRFSVVFVSIRGDMIRGHG